MDEQIFENCDGFQWDRRNYLKSWKKHDVSIGECEQVFFNKPIFVFHDKKHSLKEDRYYLLGKTDNQRNLFVVFTIRENLIRIISAREMNKKEKEIYNEKK